MSQNHPFGIDGVRLIKLPVVEIKTGKKRSSIYAMIEDNKFPKPVKIGERSSAWVEHEVDEWIQQRMLSR